MVLNIYKHPHELSYYIYFYICSKLCAAMYNIYNNLVKVATPVKIERRCRWFDTEPN